MQSILLLQASCPCSHLLSFARMLFTYTITVNPNLKRCHENTDRCLNICQPANLPAKQAQEWVIKCLLDYQEPLPSFLKTSANRTIQKQHYPAPFGVVKRGQLLSVCKAAEFMWKHSISPRLSDTRWQWWFSHTFSSAFLFPKMHPLTLFSFQQARRWWKTIQVFLSVVYEPEIKK